ncbi:MAG: Maf family protein, partial [Chloroflexota bacterium]
MTAKLKELKFILASGSPRRKELLGLLGLDFEVIPADVDESITGEESPRDYVTRVSKSKALATKPFINENTVVISADTCVVHKGEILGKPKNVEDAVSVL